MQRKSYLALIGPGQRIAATGSKRRDRRVPRRRDTVAMAECLERRDCPAAFSLELPSTPIVEGDRATFTVRMAAPSSLPERVAVNAVSETATLGRDFIFSNATQLLFAPGQTVKTFSVQTFTDTLAEGSETFRITATPLNVPNSATISAQARVYDFVATTVSASDVQVTEGNTGAVNATFTVTLSGRPILPVTVQYATRDVTATAGSDYTAASGSLVFNPGETSKTFNVVVNGDAVAEPDERFQVVLSSPTRGCRVANPIVTGTIVNDERDTPGFQITVVYSSPVSASQRAAFDAAAARWSRVITGDLPGVTLPNGTFIDDVSIDASIVAIDGAGDILGQAGPVDVRVSPDGLPYTGVMQFDAADVGPMEASGIFQGVVMHEMGHVLGLGTLWAGLVTGVGGADPQYIGVNAVREYNAIFGVTGTSVPVENTGGPGTRDSHWREATMRTELMTGFAEPGGVAMPLSRITVGSLQDIGYTVDYNGADLFNRPPIVAPGNPTGGTGVLPPVNRPTRPSTPRPTPAPAPRPTPTPKGSAPTPERPAGQRVSVTGQPTSEAARSTVADLRAEGLSRLLQRAWGSLASGR